MEYNLYWLYGIILCRVCKNSQFVCQTSVGEKFVAKINENREKLKQN